MVSATRSRRSFEQLPTRVEILGGEEITEKANMKPGDIRMLLNESTGIYVQQTSATSFNSSIRIQELDGKYTQLLRDGMPMYSGFSGGLSLLQIAPLDLQQVEVIKGASSTLYGGGAIAGLVNLVSKKPSDEAEQLQFQGVQPLTPNLLEAELSSGINADLHHTFELGDTLTLVQESEDIYACRQPAPYQDTRGTEINAVWRWNYLKLFLGYTNADVKEHGRQNTMDTALMPKERVNMVFVYEKEDDFRIGLESYYFSQQKLNNGTRSSDYWIFGLMMEKYFGDDFSMFLNFENFSDTRQTRDGPIYKGSISNPQFLDIYAPLDGFVTNGGIKLRF